MATRATKRVIKDVTLVEAEKAAQTFAVDSNKLAKLEAKMNEEVNKVKGKYQDDITKLNEGLEEPVHILHAFASEQKSSWGKRKSMELLHCIIGFRTDPPKVAKDKKFTWEAITELLKKKSPFKHFVRTTYVVDKEQILGLTDPKVLAKLKDECYLSIVQEEAFFVKAKEEVIPSLN